MNNYEEQYKQETFCKICGEHIEDLSGNPGKWGLKLPRYDKETEKTIEIHYHIFCINRVIDAYNKLTSEIARADKAERLLSAVTKRMEAGEAVINRHRGNFQFSIRDSGIYERWQQSIADHERVVKRLLNYLKNRV